MYIEIYATANDLIMTILMIEKYLDFNDNPNDDDDDSDHWSSVHMLTMLLSNCKLSLGPH